MLCKCRCVAAKVACRVRRTRACRARARTAQPEPRARACVSKPLRLRRQRSPISSGWTRRRRLSGSGSLIPSTVSNFDAASSIAPTDASHRRGEQPGMTLSYEPFSATSCRLRRSPRAFPDLRSCCTCRAYPHRSGSRRAARSRPGADGVRRPNPAPGRTGKSCRSQRIRRPQRVRLVLVAQLLLGRVPEFILAAFGPAGLLPQAVRAFSDLLFGRFGQFSSPLVKHGPPWGAWGLGRRAVQASDRRQFWPADSSLDHVREFQSAHAVGRLSQAQKFCRGINERAGRDFLVALPSPCQIIFL